MSAQVISGRTPLCSCHREACNKEVFKRYIARFNSSLGVLHAMKAQHSKCDWCFLYCDKPHRCRGCRTKLYCSQACLEADWRLVHESLCKGRGEERKVKADQRARQEQRMADREASLRVQSHAGRSSSPCKGCDACK